MRDTALDDVAVAAVDVDVFASAVRRGSASPLDARLTSCGNIDYRAATIGSCLGLLPALYLTLNCRFAAPRFRLIFREGCVSGLILFLSVIRYLHTSIIFFCSRKLYLKAFRYFKFYR